MSNHELKRYNLKSARQMETGLMLVDTSGDEWLLKGTTLLHRDNRRSDNKVAFHFQRNVSSLNQALKYIKGHSQKLTTPKKRTCRMEYLFSLI